MAMTPEQKQAVSERMKAMHAKRKADKEAGITGPSVAVSQAPQSAPMPAELNVEDLLKQIAELKANQELMAQMLNNRGPAPMGPQFGHNGRLVGTVEKYTVDPNFYPDPCERLSNEQRLKRFAFKDNYELSFEVTTTQYQTQDGINTREPRFTLELTRVVFDEDTGEPTNGRFVVGTAIFHEDPQAAIVIARENGIEVSATNEKLFLDEMRYLRMRTWLLDAFYPPKSSQPKKNKKDMVIGGKLVQYFEINSESSESIPFNQLKNKL